MFIRIVLVTILIFTLMSCRNGKTSVNSTSSSMNREIIFAPGPQTIVYKTKKDYSQFVPVTMNAQRTQIISYPSPSDIYYKGKLAKPTPLKNGYWLDNRGVNENTVFLSYTYEEYSSLKDAPQLQVMLSKVIDKNPFTEIIDCGIRSQYKNEEEDLNKLIDINFAGCKRITTKKPLDMTIDASVE